MKTLKLFLLCFMCISYAYGQQVEFAGQLNTGLTRFGGESASKSTSMVSNIQDGALSSVSNAYGKKFALSYGASVQVQQVTRSNFLFGTQAGVEVLRSRTDIREVYIFRSIYSGSFEQQEASGKAILQNDFVNLHPYLGYRVNAGAVNLDFSFGPEVGIGLKSREKGKATAQDGSKHTYSQLRSEPETDVRARLGITAYYYHIGLSASYAHGLTNYMRGYDGGNPAVYARVWRFGVLYRL